MCSHTPNWRPIKQAAPPTLHRLNRGQSRKNASRFLAEPRVATTPAPGNRLASPRRHRRRASGVHSRGPEIRRHERGSLAGTQSRVGPPPAHACSRRSALIGAPDEVQEPERCRGAGDRATDLAPKRPPDLGDRDTRGGATLGPARDGRRRPAFVVVRASRRRLHEPCSARETGLWPTACLPENWLAAGQNRKSAPAQPGRGLPSGSVYDRQRTALRARPRAALAGSSRAGLVASGPESRKEKHPRRMATAPQRRAIA